MVPTRTRPVLLALTVVLSGTLFVVAQPTVPLPPRGGGRAVSTQPEPLSDAKALEVAGLSAEDPAGLIAYLRQRTLSDADMSKIQSVIRRLGSDDFDERLRASLDAERFGPAAVAPLRAAAEGDPDPEVAYRAADCLRRVEKVPHAAVAAAAVRALTTSKPPGTAGALLGFLPLADSVHVSDAICHTLAVVAVRDGKPDPDVVKALTDATAVRRAAAVVALIVAGGRDRVAAVYPRLLQAAATETDPDAKFRMNFALAIDARESEAVGRLLTQLPDLPRGRLWQAEDLLLQLAGKDAPKAVLGRSTESRVTARDTWQDWWSKAAPTRDLASFEYVPRVTGNTIITLLDARGFSAGQVVELGPDMKERWRITGLSHPLDAQVLADGTFAIVEQSANRVTIRDSDGRVLATRTTPDPNQNRGHCMPQQVQVLPNGNLLVTYQNLVVEFRSKTGEEVLRYSPGALDIRGARRLANGETVVLFQAPPRVVTLDAQGKEVPERTLKVGPLYFQAQIVESEPGRILVAEQNRVAEYDRRDGKAVWVKTVNMPRSVQRLPNGNTLVVETTPQPSRLVEYAPNGEEVWSHAATGGYQIFRGYRR